MLTVPLEPGRSEQQAPAFRFQLAPRPSDEPRQLRPRTLRQEPLRRASCRGEPLPRIVQVARRDTAFVEFAPPSLERVARRTNVSGRRSEQIVRAGNHRGHSRASAARVHPRGALEVVRPGAFQQRAHAVVELRDDAVFPVLQRVRIERHALHLDADGRRLLGALELPGRLDQRLRRDAAPVEAHAAGLVLLDAHRLLAELPEPDGARVAAGAAADHDRVVGLHRRRS